MGCIWCLVKEWVKANPGTVFVMILISYQKCIEFNHDIFPKSVLSDPNYPVFLYIVFGGLTANFLYHVKKNWKKYSKPKSAIILNDHRKYQFTNDTFTEWSHLLYDFVSSAIFLVYVFPLVAGTVSEDLRKVMIFADFYGLFIAPFIVSVHFGLKKNKC